MCYNIVRLYFILHEKGGFFMSNMRLSDLLDTDSMRIMQRGFSRVTGMSSAIVDENGEPILRCDSVTRFCAELTRGTAAGEKRCSECDRAGAKRAMRSGKTEVYSCHVGICDMAAPIIVDGRFMGAFVGGQVIVEQPDEELVRGVANELGIDPDTYLEAMHELPVRSRQEVEDASGYMGVMAEMLSVMAQNQYEILKKNREMENMSKLKTEFLSSVNLNLYKPLQEMLFLANSINRMELSEEVAEKLRKLEKQNQKVINALADAMAFSEMTRTDSDIVETQYDLTKLCEGLKLTYTGRLLNRPVEFVLDVDEDVPTDLFGDVTRIRQILMNLLNNSVQYTEQGTIRLHISKKKTTYGLILNFEISDTGIGMRQDQVVSIQEMFDKVHDSQTINEDVLAFGLGMTSQLVNAVYGSVNVRSTLGSGSQFLVSIPQMETED